MVVLCLIRRRTCVVRVHVVDGGQVEILFYIFNRVPGTHLNIYSVHTQTCFGCGAGAEADLRSQITI